MLSTIVAEDWEMFGHCGILKPCCSLDVAGDNFLQV